MTANEIIGIVALTIMFVGLIALEFITLRQNHKLEETLNEYRKYNDYMCAKQRIIYERKVDYKSLYESSDYLTYNSKIVGESRKLTEGEFKTLKLTYLFYVWPKTKFISEFVEVTKNESIRTNNQ